MALTADDLHGLLLVKDAVDSDAGFLVAHLLKLFLGLEGRHAVVLVSCKHTMHHYAAIMRKLGVNVGAAAAAGRLVALDALRPARGRPQQLMDLRVLFGAIEGACAEAAVAAGGTPVALVFDDLTTLACAAESPDALPAFLHAAVAAAPAAACVAVVHSDVGCDAPWIARLEHAAATVAEVEALSTGASAEVGGRLSIVRQRRREVGGGGGPEADLGEEELLFGVGGDGAVRFINR